MNVVPPGAELHKLLMVHVKDLVQIQPAVRWYHPDDDAEEIAAGPGYGPGTSFSPGSLRICSGLSSTKLSFIVFLDRYGASSTCVPKFVLGGGLGGGVGQKKAVFAIFRWFSLSLCRQFLCCHNKQYGGAGTASDSLTALTASACLPCQSRQPVCEFSQKNSAAGEKIRPQAGNPPKS